MNRNRRRVLETGRSVSFLAHEAERWLASQKHMTTRLFHLETGAYEIHARHRRSESARVFGLDAALCVFIEPAGEGAVLVSVGGGSWRDKLIAAAASLFMLWPLMLCAALGTGRQWLLIIGMRRKLNSYSGY